MTSYKVMDKKLHGKIDGFVLRNYWVLDFTQMVATAMIEFGLFYDEAIGEIKRALRNIERS
ncbi:MAG: hypothetical protein MUP81_01400 [Dehalococcoidia bacterium]|nr:hypothetical protein [Dehalococcoidia bacterium]